LPYREASAASALEPNEGIAWGNLMLKVLKVEVMVEMNVRGQISTDITLVAHVLQYKLLSVLFLIKNTIMAPQTINI